MDPISPPPRKLPTASRSARFGAIEQGSALRRGAVEDAIKSDPFGGNTVYAEGMRQDLYQKRYDQRFEANPSAGSQGQIREPARVARVYDPALIQMREDAQQRFKAKQDGIRQQRQQAKEKWITESFRNTTPSPNYERGRRKKGLAGLRAM